MRLLGALVVLAALAAVPVLLPFAEAHHMPPSNRYVAGNHGATAVSGVVCLVGRPGIGGACLSVIRDDPGANADVRIRAVDDVLGPAGFRWEAYADDGSPCGPNGLSSTGSFQALLPPACTHVRVFVRFGHTTGIASVEQI